MYKEICQQDLMSGILHLKSLGFKALVYSPIPFEEVEKPERITEMPLNDSNPICRRLFEIFAMNGVVERLMESSAKQVTFSALKPTTINDAFYHAGHFRIIK